MFWKSLMAAAAIVSASLAAYAEDTMTLDQYTKYLLDTYGGDTKITGAIIYGVAKPAQPDERVISDYYPPPDPTNRILNDLDESATIVSVALIEPLACSPIIFVGPTVGTTQSRWCTANRVVQGVTYEIRRDLYANASGMWSFSGSSGFYDCQNNADKNAMPNPQVRSKCP